MEATLRQALDAAAVRLASVSRQPRRDAELLLMHVLKVGLAELLAHPDRVLPASAAAHYEGLLARRQRAEPMQYITGEQEFFGMSFRVNSGVLIPRPETEHLVEALVERVDPEAALRIVDVGTGSGAIAVALAHALRRSRVTAVDLSDAALAVAQQNAQRHCVLERMRFLHSDLLAALAGEEFDAVVSNPPYVAEGEALEPQVADYEPRSALYAGPTGLEIYRRLIPQARDVLKANGWLMLEIGYGQRAAILSLLAGWKDVDFLDDLQGIARVAIARRAPAAG
ncbi:MAG TPA: peptide chain release factor N(5)-glutamine methyltransferase [Acidobacteriaceae bacterium]|nr:peptide chain release factor N(5)-glutamine methyltransferase [Acidobacteriaceae bacterium]